MALELVTSRSGLLASLPGQGAVRLRSPRWQVGQIAQHSLSVGADSPPSTGTGRRAFHPNGTAPTALRCCVVQETRLDTARIRAARRVIDPIFLDTPLYLCEALEPGLGCTVSIKLDTSNPVRSFKARGTEVLASLLAGN